MSEKNYFEYVLDGVKELCIRCFFVRFMADHQYTFTQVPISQKSRIVVVGCYLAVHAYATNAIERNFCACFDLLRFLLFAGMKCP